MTAREENVSLNLLSSMSMTLAACSVLFTVEQDGVQTEKTRSGADEAVP